MLRVTLCNYGLGSHHARQRITDVGLLREGEEPMDRGLAQRNTAYRRHAEIST